MLGPVHGGVDVVGNVVAIVPALVVEFHVDAGDAILEVVTWVVRTNEGVLGPIPSHGHQTEG